jgi:O-antigen ligase
MSWMPRLRAIDGYAALVVGAASLYAAALVIVLSSASWLYSLPLICATVFPLVLYASRNPRLFFLFGLAFTAPLGLALRFRVHQHMGGAFAVSINLMDFFLVPLAIFLARDYYLGHRRDLRLSSVSSWWLALVGLGLYSVAAGPYREMSALEILQMLKLWLLFVVIVNECVRERHFHYVLAGLCANLVVNIVVALIQYAIKGTLGLGPLGEPSDIAALGANIGVYGENSSVFRVTGLAGHANLFGPYLAMSLPVLIGVQFTGYRAPFKLFAAAVAAGSLVCLVLTLSRSAWASFALAGGAFMLAVFVLPELRRRYLPLKFAMLAASIVALFVASGTIVRRLTESDPGAFDFRLELVKIAWNMVAANPLLGVGLNTFDFHIDDYGPYSYARLYDVFGEMFPVVHNIYMIVWSEQGTIGLVAFLAMHASILLIAARNLGYRGLSDRIYMISLGAACGVLGLMLDGFSSFFIKVETFGRIFWIFVGLIVAAHYWNVRNRPLRGGGLPAAPGAGKAPQESQ